jgi:hypothetical protein
LLAQKTALSPSEVPEGAKDVGGDGAAVLAAALASTVDGLGIEDDDSD